MLDVHVLLTIRHFSENESTINKGNKFYRMVNLRKFTQLKKQDDYK